MCRLLINQKEAQGDVIVVIYQERLCVHACNVCLSKSVD